MPINNPGGGGGGAVEGTAILSTGETGAVKFLREDGDDTSSWQAVPAPAATPKVKTSTRFGVDSQFGINSGGSGSANGTGGNGMAMNTGGTANSFVQVLSQLGGNSGTNFQIYNSSPMFSFIVDPGTTPITGNQAFFGVGELTMSTGTGHLFTDNHIGFKLTETGSTWQLIATQADGSTENASGVLTTFEATDMIEFIAVVNGSTSVDYYWRKNGGALSAATNLTSNLPTITTATQTVQFSIANPTAAAANTTLNAMSFAYER